MRVVVDEGVPRQLVAALQNAGIDAHRFKPIWKGFTNGRLIAAIEHDGFDVLLTNDKNMASQQNLRGRTVAVVALPTNRRSPISSTRSDAPRPANTWRSNGMAVAEPTELAPTA